MKKIFTFLFFFIAAAALNAQSVLTLNEDFEGGTLPDGWSVITDPGGSEWGVTTELWNTPTLPHNGDYAASTLGFQGSALNAYLVTPKLELSNYDSARITGYYVNPDWGGDVNGFAILYSTSSTGPWTTLFSTTTAHNVWTSFDVNLTSICGRTDNYYIAFRSTNGYGAGVCVDDIALEGTFRLTVGNTWVNTDNYTHITSDEITGSIAFNPETKTLTLDNATCTTNKNAIWTNFDMTIDLVGKSIMNNLQQEQSYPCIYAKQNLEITGNGILDIIAGYYGIYTPGNLTIDHTSVHIENENDYYKAIGVRGTLTIDYSTIWARHGGIAEMTAFTLNGNSFIRPQGAHYDATERCIVDQNGDCIDSEILIAPNNFPLYVADVQVTADNFENITGDGISGSVSYNPATKTLTLDNATIITPEDVSDGIINYNVSYLTINLIGNNSIEADDDGLELGNITTITGAGTLDVQADYGIYAQEGNLYIRNTNITVHGNKLGLFGNSSGNVNLEITQSNVYATGVTKRSIGGFISLILDDCEIVRPHNATYDESIKTLIDENGDTVKTEVAIEATYPLFVADVQVIFANKDNITGDGISGSVSYDPATKTLTLNNATITNTVSNDGIFNQGIRDLTINLIGTNTITAADDGIQMNESTTITGNGDLTTNSEYGLYGYSGDLSIENTTITINSSKEGLVGHEGQYDLKITNSSVRIVGAQEYASICCFGDILLTDCIIAVPAGAYYDDEERKLVDEEGNPVFDDVWIAPSYHIWVSGIQVSDVNKDNITGDDISGNISYNSETNTLTLNNATITAGYELDEGIFHNEFGLTIELIGDNEINGYYYGIYNDTKATITGSGTLVLNATYTALYHDDHILNIVNTSLTCNGGEIGIRGAQVLFVINSTIRATGASASIRDFSTIVFNNAAIVQPVGAYYDEQRERVCDSLGNVVTTEVIIEAGAVSAIRNTELADLSIYPNPASDFINVIADGFNTIEIFNFVGQKVFTNPVTTNTMHINLSTFSNGVYILRLLGNGEVVTKKFMKN